LSYPGLVGGASGTTTAISNSYASGNIIGGTGGTSGTIASVYYNSEGTSKADGEGAITSGVFALASNYLKKKNSFLNWDFDEIWNIDEDVSYPYLRIYVSLANHTAGTFASTNAGEDIVGNGVYTVSFGHLPKGMYIVKVSYGSEKHILRLPVR
jgi:hypothetical protein